MSENDTVKLLRECDSGVEMGMSAIDDVIPYVKSKALRQILTVSKEEHEKIEREIRTFLRLQSDEGKDPNPVVKGMSWMKTNVKLTLNESDSVVADLMTDGCNMGVKSLSKYLNEYKSADTGAKDIARRLINLEERLAVDIRCYL